MKFVDPELGFFQAGSTESKGLEQWQGAEGEGWVVTSESGVRYPGKMGLGGSHARGGPLDHGRSLEQSGQAHRRILQRVTHLGHCLRIARM